MLDGKQGSLFVERLALPAIRAGLLVVAFIMTWKGVTDFVSARQAVMAGEAVSIGGQTLSWQAVTSIVSFFVVLMLIIAMYVALKRMLTPVELWKRAFAGVLYALLFLFSVGFGYGFWWGLFASKNVSEAQAQAASNELHAQIIGITTRLEGAQRDIISVAQRSREIANTEASVGKTCGDNSGPTRGKRADFRNKLADDFETTANKTTTEIRDIQQELKGIDTPLQAYLNRTDETGRTKLTELDSSLQQSVISINGRLEHVRSTLFGEMTAKRDELTRKPGEPNFICNDEDLARELGRAIEQVKNPIVLQVRKLTYTENAQATAAAVERLWQSVGDVLQQTWAIVRFRAPRPFVFSIALFNEEAGGGRNIAAFIAAVGVDLALLIFVLIGPDAPLDSFERIAPASAANLDKLLFLLETFIKKGDQDAVRFWRRCLINVKGRAFFLAPNPDLAPPDKRPLLEATEVLASVFSEVNGTALASRVRFRNAWTRGVQRLSAWGWDKPTSGHFDLYLLNPGEFREIATRLAQHMISEDIAPTLSTQTVTGEAAGQGLLTAVTRRLGQAVRSELAAVRASLAGPGGAADQPFVEDPATLSEAKPKSDLLDILASVHSSGAAHEVRGTGALFRDGMVHENGRRRDSDLPGTAANGASGTSPGAHANGRVNQLSSEPHADMVRGDAANGNLSAGQTANGSPAGSGASGGDAAHPDNAKNDNGRHSSAESDGSNAIMIDFKDIVDKLHDEEFAIKFMKTQDDAEGLDAIRRKWHTTLEKYEIEAFGKVGERPDPNAYFIRGSKPSSLPVGEVAEVLRSGYRRHGRVLHEADVIVSEGMPNSPVQPG